MRARPMPPPAAPAPAPAPGRRTAGGGPAGDGLTGDGLAGGPDGQVTPGGAGRPERERGGSPPEGRAPEDRPPGGGPPGGKPAGGRRRGDGPPGSTPAGGSPAGGWSAARRGRVPGPPAPSLASLLTRRRSAVPARCLPAAPPQRASRRSRSNRPSRIMGTP